jgi:hypothetical protein
MRVIAVGLIIGLAAVGIQWRLGERASLSGLVSQAPLPVKEVMSSRVLLPTDVSPVHYDLHVTTDLENSAFSG